MKATYIGLIMALFLWLFLCLALPCNLFAIEVLPNGQLQFVNDGRFYTNKATTVANALDAENVSDESKIALIERIIRDQNCPAKLVDPLFSPSRRYTEKIRLALIVYVAKFNNLLMSNFSSGSEWTQLALKIFVYDGQSSQPFNLKLNSRYFDLVGQSADNYHLYSKSTKKNILDFAIARLGDTRSNEIPSRLASHFLEYLDASIRHALSRSSNSTEFRIVKKSLILWLGAVEDIVMYAGSEHSLGNKAKLIYETLLQDAASGSVFRPEIWSENKNSLLETISEFAVRNSVSLKSSETKTLAPIANELLVQDLLKKGNTIGALKALNSTSEPINLMTMILLVNAAKDTPELSQSIAAGLFSRLDSSLQQISDILKDHPALMSKLGVCEQTQVLKP